MRKLTSALSLTTAMLLSLSAVQAAEMNKDTRINQAQMPSGPSHDQEMNTQMNRAMDATMKNDAMKHEMLMAPKDSSMKTAAPGSSTSDEAMGSEDSSMKTTAMGATMKSGAMNKDPLPGGKQ